jgi:hypothetical protein
MGMIACVCEIKPWKLDPAKIPCYTVLLEDYPYLNVIVGIFFCDLVKEVP